ncbi:MAG: phytanoyl-CoA dioxygenase family protein [Polyangiaceae bacterium]|nr:phytanoyl-CoA dioxygenase family protein [Polyangiaceae bacterium]
MTDDEVTELPSAARLDEAVASYRERGFARLGKCVSPALLAEMRARVDAMMRGELRYEGLFFQRDTDTGRYEDLGYGHGWVGPTLSYRKLEKLERDPVFLAFIQAPLFREVTRRLIGPAVTLYRAVVFNKAAETGGSDTPWHQDGGRFWGLDRDPGLQAWTALDDAPVDGGCLEVLEGSHRLGLATPLGGVVPARLLEEADAEARALPLPAEAGEVILLHNYAWHRTRRGRVGHARRALTVCYLDAATRCLRRKHAPRTFLRVF